MAFHIGCKILIEIIKKDPYYPEMKNYKICDTKYEQINQV